MIGSFKKFSLLQEDKVQWLKDNTKEIKTDHDALAQHTEPHAIIDHWASADPTPKKQYTQWAVNKYHQGNFRQEDHPRVSNALANFDKYKGKLEKKDINQYKSLSDVEDAVTPHLGQAASKKEEKRQIKDEGADLVHSENDVTVHHIKTPEAAKLYGSNTKWCTAGKGEGGTNMFNGYSKQGPIYVAQTEGGGKRKYQLHFHTNQFMNEKDEPVKLDALAKKHPELKNVEAFKGQHPVFDTKEGLIDKATTGKTYPGGHSAVEFDAKSSKPALQTHHLDQIYADGLTSHYNLANHPNTSGDTLHKLLDSDVSVQTSIAKHPNITADSVSRLVKDYKHHADLAVNPSLNSGQLDDLHHAATGKTFHYRTHEAIASHPNASPERLHGYVQGGDGPLNHIAAQNALNNPNTPAHSFEHAHDNNPALHPALAASPHTPAHVLQRLVTSPHEFIADNAKKNLAKKGIK